jgi:hypothetical protein
MKAYFPMKARWTPLLFSFALFVFLLQDSHADGTTTIVRVNGTPISTPVPDTIAPGSEAASKTEGTPSPLAAGGTIESGRAVWTARGSIEVLLDGHTPES